MHPTRRHLLTTTSLAAASMTSGWLPKAFSTSGTSATDLARAYEDARRKGRPLLVIVIPEAIRRNSIHGQAWAAVLDHSSWAVRAALQLCELTCARGSAIHLAFGNQMPQRLQPDPDANSIGMLLDTDDFRVRPIHRPPHLYTIPNRWPYDRKERYEKICDTLYAMWVSVGRVVFPSSLSLARRATQEAAALTLDPAGLSLEDRALLAPAGLYADQCLLGLDRVVAAQILLAAEFDRRMQNQVPGARWSTPGGCGSMGSPCGTASMTMTISRRFLSFYSA